MTLIVVCGLIREARIARRLVSDMFVVIGGGQAGKLRADLDDMAELFPGSILSAGIAGALDPRLKPGDTVIDGDPDVVARLKRALPGAIVGKVAGSDTIAADPLTKAIIAARTEAVAVDMESHIAASIARAHECPFGIVRVISDTAGETLPPAALVGMRPDGGMALGKVLASLAHDPGQLPELIRIGRQSALAFKNLARAFDALARARYDAD